MKKVAYSLVLAAGLASSSVMAADMAVKAPPAAVAILALAATKISMSRELRAPKV